MIEQVVNVERIEQIINLFGSFDENIKIIEKEYSVNIVNRDTELKISGDALDVMHAKQAVQALLGLAARGEQITTQNVNYVISLVRDGQEDKISQMGKGVICVTVRGKQVKAKTLGQQVYVDAIKNNIVTVGVGPAGTGKTYLAVACAVAAFREKQVNKIILTRPAVEAGESLGYLPGTISEKVDPYVRPLYDALFDMVDAEKGNRLVDQNIIEIAPLAYMRGRTLDDCFVILDEAQNTTPEQMKMFLTRLGFGTKMVVTGDITQIDLPNGSSGLRTVRGILEGIPDIAFCDLTPRDVVRHSLVARIVAAYDEANEAKGGTSKKEQ